MSSDDTIFLERQLEYQKKLNSITNKIHAADDTDDILLNLQTDILSLFDADRITVYVMDNAKNEIVSRFKTGDEVSEIRLVVNDGSIAGFCALSGRVINVADVYDRNELNTISPKLKFDGSWDQITGYKTTEVLAAPIIFNNNTLGVVQLINKKTGPRFTEEDRASLLDIAGVLGPAIFKNNKVAERVRRTKFDLLLDNSIISQEDIQEAMNRGRKRNVSVESVLMADFHVTKEDMGRSLSNFYQTRFIPFDDKMVIPGELLKGLKPGFLKENNVAPVGQVRDTVIVTMEDPHFLPARDAIKRLIKAKKFEYCVSLKEDIVKMIDMFFDVKRSNILPNSGTIEEILGQLTPVDEDETACDSMSQYDSAIVQLVNKMIVDAYNRGASDIHIEPRSGKKPVVVRIRVDGACQVYQTIPHTYKRALVSRIKIMSDLDIAEKRLPQDGKIKFKRYAPLDIEIRVATIPTAGRNEDVVMRLLSTEDPVPLHEIGMSERDYKEFTGLIAKPYGMVLVVGPTGSGKTTTLHAAMHHINRPETKIWTAEDPVEITQEGLRQVQVHPKIGLDFAAAMRAFLRADPDVIMVGEMRDHETVSTGIEASLTGHLLLSTLHTNSAPETITRLLDMGMDPFNFADALLGVLAQRLARTLCNNCKERYHPTREEFDGLVRLYNGDFASLGFEYNRDFFLYRPIGCNECGNTGYRGRTGLFELLLGTDEIKLLIQVRAKIEDLRRQAAKNEGMTTLMQDGIRKVCLGLTDIKQVRRVCIR
ncbi:Prevent-host-death family protein [uncultured Desulfobacterium sp.]|uniref:Prevent-host-death family protein n=1 Tax=uncultured Desulfobacterium sp. TaxID=201089 RepID=A0A445MYM7_9BACT|nr:Prevent-host-death family protein [uncultured Desulfobacterium sp.]